MLCGVAVVLCGEVVVLSGVVVGSSAIVGLLFDRLGRFMIMRSICLCVRCSLFSNSWVSVQAAVPYKIVGVIVPWNNLNRPRNEYDLVVSSCLSMWNDTQHYLTIMRSTMVATRIKTRTQMHMM